MVTLGGVLSIGWMLDALLICLRGICMPYADADLAVVFGNALDRNGAPKAILAARLDVAVWSVLSHRPLSADFRDGKHRRTGLDEASATRTYYVSDRQGHRAECHRR